MLEPVEHGRQPARRHPRLACELALGDRAVLREDVQTTSVAAVDPEHPVRSLVDRGGRIRVASDRIAELPQEKFTFDRHLSFLILKISSQRDLLQADRVRRRGGRTVPPGPAAWPGVRASRGRYWSSSAARRVRASRGRDWSQQAARRGAPRSSEAHQQLVGDLEIVDPEVWPVVQDRDGALGGLGIGDRCSDRRSRSACRGNACAATRMPHGMSVRMSAMFRMTPSHSSSGLSVSRASSITSSACSTPWRAKYCASADSSA